MTQLNVSLRPPSRPRLPLLNAPLPCLASSLGAPVEPRQAASDYTLAASGGKHGSISLCLGRHLLGSRRPAHPSHTAAAARQPDEWVTQVVQGSGRGGPGGESSAMSSLCIALARDPLTVDASSAGCTPCCPPGLLLPQCAGLSHHRCTVFLLLHGGGRRGAGPQGGGLPSGSLPAVFLSSG